MNKKEKNKNKGKKNVEKTEMLNKKVEVKMEFFEKILSDILDVWWQKYNEKAKNLLKSNNTKEIEMMSYSVRVPEIVYTIAEYLFDTLDYDYISYENGCKEISVYCSGIIDHYKKKHNFNEALKTDPEDAIHALDMAHYKIRKRLPHYIIQLAVTRGRKY